MNSAIANGSLPIPLAAAMSLLVIALGIGLAVSVGGLRIVLMYALTSISYSAGLKRFPIADIFILAGLYTLRIAILV